jgi:hypothetical protein
MANVGEPRNASADDAGGARPASSKPFGDATDLAVDLLDAGFPTVRACVE